MNISWGKRYVILLCFITLILFSLGFCDNRAADEIPHLGEEVSVYFHEKTSLYEPLSDSCSTSTNCHLTFLHGKDKRIAAFLNMHTLTLECVVCHSHSQVTLYVESKRGKRLFKTEEIDMDGDIHEVIEKKPSCRKCHSPSGAKSLEESTKVKFKATFKDPFVLKLIEEDSKKWDVPGY